jgi:hypothetical protein
MRMTRRERTVMGIALLLGAAVAFPAGMLFAGWQQQGQAPIGVPLEGAAARAVYSPALLRDPWFRDQQRKNVEALESHCRRTGELCPESRSARLAYER